MQKRPDYSQFCRELMECSSEDPCRYWAWCPACAETDSKEAIKSLKPLMGPDYLGFLAVQVFTPGSHITWKDPARSAIHAAWKLAKMEAMRQFTWGIFINTLSDPDETKLAQPYGIAIGLRNPMASSEPKWTQTLQPHQLVKPGELASLIAQCFQIKPLECSLAIRQSLYRIHYGRRRWSVIYQPNNMDVEGGTHDSTWMTRDQFNTIRDKLVAEFPDWDHVIRSEILLASNDPCPIEEIIYKVREFMCEYTGKDCAMLESMMREFDQP